MKISIRDFGRIKIADIELSPGKICLVGGRNAAGKTTVYTAAQAVLTGIRMPNGAPMNKASTYVRYGSDRAVVHAVMDDGERTIMWNPTSVEMMGLPTQNLSDTSGGLMKVAAIDKRDRATFWIDLLKATPTESDWLTAFAEIGFAGDSEFVKTKIATIDALGADAALKENKSDIEYKSKKFCEITGMKRWGSTQSLNWQPADAIELDIVKYSVPEVEKALAKARQDHEQALKAEGANDAAIAFVKEKAEGATAAEAAVGPLYTEVQALAAEKTAQRAVVEKIAAAMQNYSQPCPHCQKGVEVRSNTILKSDKPVYDQLVFTGHEAAYEEAHRIEEELQAKLAAKETEWREAKANAQAAVDAAREYARLMAKQKSAVAGVDVDKARAAVTLLERRIKAIENRDQAHKLDGEIRTLMKVSDLLEPSGIRQQCLESKLATVKAKCLDPLSRMARWLPVRIAPDLTIYGQPEGDIQETPYDALSESMQFRVDVLLALTVANIKKENTILLDRLECLEPSGREELFDLLKKAKMTALVCMVASGPSKLPDLAALGAGETMWLEKGELYDRETAVNMKRIPAKEMA